MPSLPDVLHWPPVASLLSALAAPRDAVCLVVWAMELELHDGARLVLEQHGLASFEAMGQDVVLRCAAASGFCRAATRLLECGGLEQYVAAKGTLLEESKLAFATPPLPAVAMYASARRGDLDAVTFLHALTTYEPHEAMAIAASHGHLQVARWLGERAMAAVLDPLHPYEIDLHYLASYDDTLLALTWTVQYVNASNQRANRKYFATTTSGVAPVQKAYGYATERAYLGAMDVVASEGNLALLYAMHEDQATYPWSCTPAAMDNAAAHGHLHVLEWLVENRSEGCTQAAMDGAARNGHLASLRWSDANIDELSIKTSTFLAALESGDLDTIQWLHKRRPVASLPESSAVEAACRSANRFAVLQWLDETRGIRVATKPAMSLAMRNGDKQTAQWLANATAGAKHIELWNRVVAMWMSYEFELMHDNTFSEAALNGQLETLTWLAQAGPFYKVHVDVLWKCALRGHLHIVEFILQHPAHQSPGLECLPVYKKARKPSWTSFWDAHKTTTTSGGTGADWSAWLPLAYDPAWAKPYITLWLQYRPQDCKHIAWLPQWARLCGHSDLYQQLISL